MLEVTQGLADNARQLLRGKDAGMGSCGDRLDRCSKLGRPLGTDAGGEQCRAHTAKYISRTRLRSPRRTGHCNQHRPTVRSCDDLRRTPEGWRFSRRVAYSDIPYISLDGIL